MFRLRFLGLTDTETFVVPDGIDPANDWRVYAEWTDDESVSVISEVPSTIWGKNRAPIISAAPTPLNGAVDVATIIELEVDVSDPDIDDTFSDETLKVSFYYSLDGTEPGELACENIYSDKCTFATELPKNSSVKWKAIARDDEGVTSSD